MVDDEDLDLDARIGVEKRGKGQKAQDRQTQKETLNPAEEEDDSLPPRMAT